MPRKATTFRIDAVAQEGLSMLSRLSGRPLNQLVNEAVREFVGRRTRAMENDLEATLGELRAYRMRDPDFEESVAKAAEAEAAMTYDPAEGKAVDVEPLHARLRSLLDG